MRHRSFIVAASALEPLTFDVNDDRYTCVPEAPPGTLLDLLNASRVDNSSFGGMLVSSARMITFLEQVIVPADRERFAALLHDPDFVGEKAVKALADIFEWLFEEYTGLPKAGPPDSAGSSSSNGNGSTGTAPAEESTL